MSKNGLQGSLPEPALGKSLPTAVNLSLSQNVITAPGSASSDIVKDYRCRQHLLAVVREEAPALIILSGASGSGKSWILSELKELGVATPPRLLTRSARKGDSVNDVRWNRDRSDSPLFAYEKYGEHYGFSARDVIKTLRSGQAAAVVCGDVGKIAPLIEAINSLMPLVPVVSLRLEVPLSIASKRMLEQRQEAYAGEARLRDETNREVEGWEKLQIPKLKQFWGLHTIINLTSNEHQLSGYSSKQLKPLSSELLQSLFSRFLSEAVSNSAQMAADVIRPIKLNYGADGISNSLIKTLEESVVPRCHEKAVNPVLKGGLAVAIYLNDASSEVKTYPLVLNNPSTRQPKYASPPLNPFERPVTPDIDFTMLANPRNIAAFKEILSSFAGKQVDFTDNKNKPVFKSKKASASVQTDGDKIELDAILTSQVSPSGIPFTFEFNYDSFLNHIRREVTLPSGATVSLVPPEFLIMEKLCAGRGNEVGKLDLSDSLALMITQPLDVNVFQRLISMQKYKPELDSAVREVIHSAPKLGDSAETLKELGITDIMLVHIVVERMLLEKQNQKAFAGISFSWSADSLKQIAFVNCLLKSLGKVDALISSKEDNPLKRKLLNSFDKDTVLQASSNLRDFLLYFAQFQIGRRDVFVRRRAGATYDLSSRSLSP